MIRLDQLSVGYRGRRLIDNAEASLEKGRLCALIGRNGSGKSSLLRVIMGLDQPLSGRVLLDGADLHALPAAEKARKIALVSTQRVRVSNLRCREVVALGRAPYTDWMGRLSADDSALVDQALDRVGMSAYAERPLDTLSDGESQRVMVARALAQQTPAILLDEPTSFLDLPNRHAICRLLGDLAREEGKLILFSTHELDLALRFCDDLMLIDNPGLEHAPVTAFKDSGRLERLFGL